MRAEPRDREDHQPRGLNFEELVHPSARGLSVLFESRLQFARLNILIFPVNEQYFFYNKLANRIFNRDLSGKRT